jgi:hypothetical protein
LVSNYFNRTKRNGRMKNKFVYKPTPLKKYKLEIPKEIIE